MLLALDIVNGRKYDRDVFMQSSLVTYDNASVLLLQNEEIIRQSNYLRTMHSLTGRMQDAMELQRVIIILVLVFALCISVFLSFYVMAYRQKQSLSEELQAQVEKVERQRDELEEQRDKLIELSMAGNSDTEDSAESQNKDSGLTHAC